MDLRKDFVWSGSFLVCVLNRKWEKVCLKLSFKMKT